MKYSDWKSFDSDTKNGTILVVFSAQWCVPCVEYKKTLEKVETDSVSVLIIDVDGNEPLTTKFNIMSVPTTMLFMDGEPVSFSVGVKTADQLNKIIKEQVI